MDYELYTAAEDLLHLLTFSSAVPLRQTSA
jgi:hypothetical protein